MKTKLLSTALIALTVFSVTVSRPAKAWTGILTLNAPLALAGLALSFPAALIDVYVPYPTKAQSILFSGYVLFAGIVLSEDKSVTSFSEVNADQAIVLKLTADEMESFNSEIDQVNALASEVSSELSKIKKPKLEDSKELWASLKDSVAPETFSAMQKISNQLYK